jgi:hypothetical protein
MNLNLLNSGNNAANNDHSFGSLMNSSFYNNNNNNNNGSMTRFHYEEEQQQPSQQPPPPHLTQQFNQFKLGNQNTDHLFFNGNKPFAGGAPPFQFKRPIMGHVMNPMKSKTTRSNESQHQHQRPPFRVHSNSNQSFGSSQFSNMLVSQPQAIYSRKVFVGGLPPDIDECKFFKLY